MSRRIWKFELEDVEKQYVVMPEAARILSVARQDGKFVMWALVDPDQWQVTVQEYVERSYSIWMLKTGHPVPEGFEQYSLSFVGTVQMVDRGIQNYVVHVFCERTAHINWR